MADFQALFRGFPRQKYSGLWLGMGLGLGLSLGLSLGLESGTFSWFPPSKIYIK